ncbi:MAG: hypothetical protein P9X24_18855 [Candidatus Hatepunaea meridiana]|nr:hypothetical protein [Candidatus Hatepunaea meridiana]
MRRYIWAVFLITLFTLTGCNWDPPHDNVFDPGNPNYKPLGSLYIKVLTYWPPQRPIGDATVWLPELGRLRCTDSKGEVSFSELPEGEWWVIAYRDIIPDTAYARDSIRVTINQAMQTHDSLRLDALPFFRNVRVNSKTVVDRDNQGNVYKNVYAILTAQADDPDGIGDIERIEWRLLNLMEGTLDFKRDSIYWQVEIPSEDFPGGDLINTLTLPFTFEAYDNLGNSSQSITTLARVITDVPVLRSVTPAVRQPILRWLFYWNHPFRNTDSFSYLVRILSTDAEPELVYQRYISATPEAGYEEEHLVEEPLTFGSSYLWEVWVIDLFGNHSISLRPGFTVE